jgi:DNA-binding LacI/PurR family transcriptional regulator
VRQDFATLGRRALELTLQALDGESAPVADLVTPELVVRASTGPVPGS